MKLTEQQQKSQDLIQAVIAKAWEDKAFKEELIANPIDAIEKLTGERVKLPAGKTLIVRDQTDASAIYINIPSEPNMEDMELSEDQLEVIAGGAGIWNFPIITLPQDPDKDGYQR
jgi:hypothetical protein